MDVAHQLTIVAFLRSTGGRIRLLLAVDRAGEQLFDGEPAVLVEHRPGDPASNLQVECSARIDPQMVERIVTGAGTSLAELVDSAFDDAGMFDGGRLLGRAVELVAPRGSFDS